jgi:hypothetical protein
MDKSKANTIFKVGICWLACTCAFAQSKYDYNWVLSNTKIDFRGDSVAIVNDTNFIHISQNSASFSNSIGDYLGYTNGCRIYNKEHEIVEGTDSLNFSSFVFYDDFCTSQFHSGYPSGRQSLMTLPTDSSLYFLHEISGLNLEDDFFGYSENLFNTKLLYGDNLVLDYIQQPIIEDDSIGIGSISAVKHQDDNRWWIIKHDLHSNCYYKVLFENGEFIETGYQCIGNINSANGDGGGGARFSPQGGKYARFTPTDALSIFDFNRETGILSNYEYIDIPQTGLSGGISFSPSGQFLYISDPLFIRQYDVWSSDIAESEVIVAEYDGFIGNSLGQGTTFGQMQLAPDCRIYINTGPNLSYMHIIMRPDEKGIACDVKQHSIDLPFPNSRNLPYFPNYRLDTDEPLCDSTKVIVLNGTMPPVATVDLQGEVKVFPNPASHFINVLLDKKGDYTMSIMDMAGLQVLAVETSQAEVTIDVRGLSVGIYVLQVLDSNTGKRMVKKVMVK